MPGDEYIEKIPVKTIRNILANLQDYAKAKSADDNFIRPQLTVLVAGAKVEGEFYRFGEDEGQELLMLKPLKDNSIFVINLGEVRGLYINQPETIAQVISFGEISRPLNEVPMEGLALSKEFKSMSQQINSICGGNLNFEYADVKDAVANANALDIAKTTIAGLKEICDDQAGKDAVKKFNNIKIVPSDNKTISVKKEGSVIVISRDLSSFLEFSLKDNITAGLNSIL